MLFKKDPKRVIAMLEPLASLIAVKLWMPSHDKHTAAKCWIRGKTDNLSNTFAVSKWMSTKFPLTIFVMELSESLRTSRCFLHLDWVPRDLNQLADDLTNEKFGAFEAARRVRWSPQEQSWIVLDRFMQFAKEYHEEMKSRKVETRQVQPKKRKNEKRLGPW